MKLTRREMNRNEERKGQERMEDDEEIEGWWKGTETRIDC